MNQEAKINIVCDNFARQAKAKMLGQLLKGRSGWDDPAWLKRNACNALQRAVYRLIAGDTSQAVDVCNYAMMLESPLAHDGTMGVRVPAAPRKAKPIYSPKINLDQIKVLADSCKAKGGVLVYAVHSPWWMIWETADTQPPYRVPGGSVPCDPRGSVLLQTDDPHAFIAPAESNPSHYGKHGLRAFVAAYHGNVVVEKGGRFLPTSLDSWDAYEAAIDAYDDDKSNPPA